MAAKRSNGKWLTLDDILRKFPAVRKETAEQRMKDYALRRLLSYGVADTMLQRMLQSHAILLHEFMPSELFAFFGFPGRTPDYMRELMPEFAHEGKNLIFPKHEGFPKGSITTLDFLLYAEDVITVLGNHRQYGSERYAINLKIFYEQNYIALPIPTHPVPSPAKTLRLYRALCKDLGSCIISNGRLSISNEHLSQAVAAYGEKMKSRMFPGRLLDRNGSAPHHPGKIRSRCSAEEQDGISADNDLPNEVYVLKGQGNREHYLVYAFHVLPPLFSLGSLSDETLGNYLVKGTIVWLTSCDRKAYLELNASTTGFLSSPDISCNINGTTYYPLLWSIEEPKPALNPVRKRIASQ